MTRPTAPKGTRDIVGEELTRFRLVEDAARRLFGLHGFQEIRPPVFESRDLFSRSVGETSDIVEKEMFSSWPVSALVAGVKMGEGNLSA